MEQRKNHQLRRRDGGSLDSILVAGGLAGGRRAAILVIPGIAGRICPATDTGIIPAAEARIVAALAGGIAANDTAALAGVAAGVALGIL